MTWLVVPNNLKTRRKWQLLLIESIVTNRCCNYWTADFGRTVSLYDYSFMVFPPFKIFSSKDLTAKESWISMFCRMWPFVSYKPLNGMSLARRCGLEDVVLARQRKWTHEEVDFLYCLSGCAVCVKIQETPKTRIQLSLIQVHSRFVS